MRKKTIAVSDSNEKNTKTIVVDSSSRKTRKKMVSYIVLVFLGAIIVVSLLLFLTYQSFTVLFPWMFGESNIDGVERHYVGVKIPVWDTDHWRQYTKQIADAGEEFTISYVYSQFTASLGFTFGFDIKQRLRVVSVEKTDQWNVFLAGSGIPFYSSDRLRGLICEALNDIETNIGNKVRLVYDGEDVKNYIPCNSSEGFMVFYVRGNSVRARWIYESNVNKADVPSFLKYVLQKASDLGDANLVSMISSVSVQDNTIFVDVKPGVFVNASTFIKNALVYNLMYLYPYIKTIQINDPQSLPYTDTRLDPVLLVPTTSEDFIAQVGDRLTFVKRLKSMFPVIDNIKIGNRKAIVNFSTMPSREIVEAVARSVISLSDVDNVLLSVKGKIPPFWADPFEEDF